MHLGCAVARPYSGEDASDWHDLQHELGQATRVSFISSEFNWSRLKESEQAFRPLSMFFFVLIVSAPGPQAGIQFCLARMAV